MRPRLGPANTPQTEAMSELPVALWGQAEMEGGEEMKKSEGRLESKKENLEAFFALTPILVPLAS